MADILRLRFFNGVNEKTNEPQLKAERFTSRKEVYIRDRNSHFGGLPGPTWGCRMVKVLVDNPGFLLATVDICITPADLARMDAEEAQQRREEQKHTRKTMVEYYRSANPARRRRFIASMASGII